MQSLSQQNPAINLSSLHSDLLGLIMLKLPLKYSWLARRVCRSFNFDRTIECQHRFDNMTLVDFTFISKRSKGNWTAFIAQHKDSKLLPLVYKVFLSGSYVLWCPPAEEIGYAIPQFEDFMICYSHLCTVGQFCPADTTSAIRESAKKCVAAWAEKFNLPLEDWSNSNSQQIFRSAWQQTQNHLHGTYLGIAQVFGRDKSTVSAGIKQLHDMAPHCLRAKLTLGFMHRHGVGVVKHQPLAVDWFQRAADQKDPIAQDQLAQQYEHWNGDKPNLQEAFAWYRRAADQNHLNAMNTLALMHLNGRGVEKNEAEALRLFRIAAKNHDAQAQYNLGVQYLNGCEVDQNYDEALRWLYLSAIKDYSSAPLLLGCLYEEGRGVTKDLEAALRWYKKAAQLNEPEAQCRIGRLYYFGQGTRKNDKAAAKWYTKAAENAVVDAQTSIAYMYTNGIGVEKNVEEAIKWYKLAAKQDSPLAKLCLGILLPAGPEADQLFEEGKKGLDEKLLKALSAEPTDVAKQIVARLTR